MPSIYSLDLTGFGNPVINETQSVPLGAVRLIVPTQGAFFGDSISVRSMGVALIPMVDYQLVHPIENISRSCGLSAYIAINIKKPGVSQVSIDYNAVGGDYALTGANIDALKAINNDNVISYNSLLDLPPVFPPAFHTHFADDISWTGVKQALKGISDALEMNSAGGLANLYNYLKRMNTNKEFEVDAGVFTGFKHCSVRHRATGFTMCLGELDLFNDPVQEETEVRRYIFRRAFSTTPVVVVSGSTLFDIGDDGRFKNRYTYTAYGHTASSFKIRLDTDITYPNPGGGTNNSFLSRARRHRGYIAYGMSASDALVSDVDYVKYVTYP